MAKRRRPPTSGSSSFPLSTAQSTADDRETPQRALCDVAPLLTCLFGTDKPVKIYDPYYCHGGIKNLLLPLLPQGSSVYNKKEDFYSVKRAGLCPDHDVLLTNPPYSKDHIRRALEYCISRKAPWFMLLPHNVLLRDWYSSLISRDVSSPIYICPHQRYAFQVVTKKQLPGTSHATLNSEHTPFVTIWLVGGLTSDAKEKMMDAWEACSRKDAATLAQNFGSMPRRIRKLMKFASQRVNKKMRNKVKSKTKLENPQPTSELVIGDSPKAKRLKCLKKNK